MNLPPEVHRKVNRIESLATLPNIAAEILDLIRSPASNMREIARVIEKDPSVTSKIIKVSNSPLWGFSGRIDNVQRALILLGLKQVSNIVIAVSLYSTFAKLKPNPDFDREKFWLHSAGTGQIARTFSRKLALNYHGEDFVAALIHDIGKMVLDQFFSNKFRYILSKSKEMGRPVIELEREELGCTHADVGGWLLEHWNFPASIHSSVRFHHCPEQATTARDLAAVVHLSDSLCELWGVGFDHDLQKFSIKDNAAWKILSEFHPGLYELDMEKFTFELNSEMEKAQLFIDLIRE